MDGGTEWGGDGGEGREERGEREEEREVGREMEKAGEMDWSVAITVGEGEKGWNGRVEGMRGRGRVIHEEDGGVEEGVALPVD